MTKIGNMKVSLHRRFSAPDSDNDDQNMLEIAIFDAPLIFVRILMSEPLGEFGRVTCVSEIDEMKLDVPKEMVRDWRKYFSSTGRSLPLWEKDLVKKNIFYLYPAFTRVAQMSYVCSEDQLRELIFQLETFAISLHYIEPDIYMKMPSDFAGHLRRAFLQFIRQAQEYLSAFLPKRIPFCKTPFFATRPRAEIWGESYCTTYKASLYYLFDIYQRLNGRTASSYEMSFIRENDSNDSMFVLDVAYPLNLRPDSKRGLAWKRDMDELMKDGLYPLCTIVSICECGTLDTFIYNCRRFNIANCESGTDLLTEVQSRTIATLEKYYDETIFLGGEEMEAVAKQLNKFI